MVSREFLRRIVLLLGMGSKVWCGTIDALIFVVGKMTLHSSQQNAPGQIGRQQQQQRYLRK